MATERKSPDAILELTNLTGTVSEIQDDPDSPDANWLDAVANNVSSICRTSFPTPTGNPTVGADLQEFRVLVRKFGGTGTPTAWVELWENGVSIRVGSSINVTGTHIISFLWNANEIGTADGSLVECRLNSLAVGGAPAGRATVEVGAVEWNITYSAGVTEYLAGITNGIASVSGTAKRSRVLAGISTCMGGISGVAKIDKKISGLISGIASVSATAKMGRVITGLSSGVALAAGALTVSAGQVIEYLAGLIGGLADVSGAVKINKKLVSITQGATSITGVARLNKRLAGAISNYASVTGVVAITHRIGGAINGVASVAGNLTKALAEVLLSGIVSGIANITGKLSYYRILKLYTGATISQDLNLNTLIEKNLFITTALGRGLQISGTVVEK